MSKRRALNQYTKEDFEREEEQEDEEPVPTNSTAEGEQSFMASREVMERRSVIKAKRRTLANDSIASSSSATPMPSPFGGIKLVPSGSTTPFQSSAPLFGAQSSTSLAFGTPTQPSFGVNNSNNNSSNNQLGGFKFGTSSAGQSSTPANVKFGVPSASTSTYVTEAAPFSFSPSKQPASFTTPMKQPMTTIGLSFNASPKLSTQPSSTASSASNVLVNGTSSSTNNSLYDGNPELASRLKKLNNDFIKHLQPHLNSEVVYDFSDVCRDYLNHVKNLEEKYGAKKPTTSSVPSLLVTKPAASPVKADPPVPASKPPTFGFLNSSSSVTENKSSPSAAPAFSSGPMSASKPLTFGPAATVTKPTFGLSASASPFTPSSPQKISEPEKKQETKPFSFGVPTGTTSTASTASSFSGTMTSSAPSGFSFAGAASSQFGTGFNPKATSSPAQFSFGSQSSGTQALPGNNATKPTASFGFGSSPQTSSFAPSLQTSSSFESAAAKPAFSFSSKPPATFGSGSISSLFSSPAPSSTAATPLFGSTTLGSSVGGNFQSTVPSTSSEGGDDEEYVPPKVEDVKAEEQGSIYSKRVKLFKKGEKQYESVGIGMLHVKKLDTGKHQLIVRGENAIGSIWLNTILAPGVIIKKMPSKKDVQIVTMVSAPLPAAGGLRNGGEEEVKTVIHLFRCTNEEHADELEQKLKSYKG